MASQRSGRNKKHLHPAFDAMEDRVLCSLTVVVPGTANPYLADPSNDSGPTDATDGTKPPSINVTGDSLLTFSATGGATNELGVFPIEPPDGGAFVSADHGARGVISSWDLPVSSLAGVFLGPTLRSAPPEYTGSLSATSIAPPLGQVFFIGDGLTGHGSGSPQNFHVPSGATTLFLADIDSHVWSDNGGKFTVTITPTTTPTPGPISGPTPGPRPSPRGNPVPTHSPTPAPNPAPTSAPTPTPTTSPTQTPGLTPPPAARPLPVGFLRTPPEIVRVATKMVDRAPEIVLEIDQGIVSKLALKKVWYSVDTPGADDAPGTSNDQHTAVSKVVYQAKTHTITLVMPKNLKVRGTVLLTVAAPGIVNLLGQQLEGDNEVPGVNLVQEVDLP